MSRRIRNPAFEEHVLNMIRNGNADVVGALPKGIVAPNRPKRSQPDESRMNKTEERFSWHLEALKRAGECEWWGFKPFPLRLGKRHFFRIDFAAAFLSDPHLWVIDVKARGRDGKARTEDDALSKAKSAAVLFPIFTVAQAWEDETGQWQFRTFPGPDPPLPPSISGKGGRGG